MVSSVRWGLLPRVCPPGKAVEPRPLLGPLRRNPCRSACLATARRRCPPPLSVLLPPSTPYPSTRSRFPTCRHRSRFLWTEAATTAFEALKQALSTASVLHLPDFGKPFVVDCDASGSSFGAVLHQGAGPLAFYSKPFAPRHLKIAAYERELIGLVQAVRHWRPYLWGRSFVARTDHYALKFMLDQRLSTVPQHQWICKLFGFDFSVEYRLGRLNTVADALSHREPKHITLGSLSGPTFVLFSELKEELNSTDELRRLRDNIVATRGAPWRVEDGLILRGTRVFIPAT